MKVAVIGCGFFAQNQLHAWADIADVEVAALCDLDQDRLAATAKHFKITRTYTDATALFAAGGFDVVDIATTVNSHRTLVEMAAKAGVHVICQKPFAPNLEDARAMVAAMSNAGKALMVHENFRWQSPIQAALHAVNSGAIGTPFFGRFSFRSGYDVFAGQPYLAEGDRFIIEDLGIHILDIARAFFGDATHIAATTSRVNPAIKGEDVATMLLIHGPGMTSLVDCSYATRRMPETFPQTLIEIDGTHGTLRLDAGYQLTVQADGDSTTADVSPQLLPWAERPWHNIQESLLRIQQHFIDCLKTVQAPATSGRDNLKTLVLVEAAYISARESRTVVLADL